MQDWSVEIHVGALVAIVAAVGGAAAWFARLYASAKNAQIEQLKAEREHFKDLCSPSLWKYQRQIQRELRQQLAQISGQARGTANDLSITREELAKRTDELDQLREKEKIASAIAKTVIADRGELMITLSQLEDRLRMLETAATHMDTTMDKFSTEYERALRRSLDVPESASVDDVLSLIEAEGWKSQLFSEEVDGAILWACQISKGIFRTVQQDPQTGTMGHKGSPTRELAALEGLRRARGEDPPREC